MEQALQDIINALQRMTEDIKEINKKEMESLLKYDDPDRWWLNKREQCKLCIIKRTCTIYNQSGAYCLKHARKEE